MIKKYKNDPMQTKGLDWQPADRHQQTVQAKKLFGILLKARRLSPVTIGIYEKVIHTIGEKLDLLAPNPPLLTKYFYERFKKTSHATANVEITAIKHFYSDMIETGLLPPNFPVTLPALPLA